MADSKQQPNFENDFMEISTDENGNKIYTFSKAFFVAWPWRPDTLKNKYMYTMAYETNYGFLRVICDANSKILAYTRAMPIVPDPFPSQFHTYSWYAFETYNRELIKDFDINVYDLGALSGILCFMDENERPNQANWKYNAKENTYDLKMFTEIGSIKHWFLVTDKDITSDYGMHETRRYKFNTNLNKPNPVVVSYVNNQLIDAGIKPKDNNLFSKIRKPFQKISVSFRDIFQKERGAQ